MHVCSMQGFISVCFSAISPLKCFAANFLRERAEREGVHGQLLG